MAPRREWGSERPTPAQVTREQRAEPAVGSPPGTAANEALVGTPGGEGRGSGLATLRAGARPGQGAALAGCTLHRPPPHTHPRVRKAQGEWPTGAGNSAAPTPVPTGRGSSRRRPEPGTPHPAATTGWPRSAPGKTGRAEAPAPGSRHRGLAGTSALASCCRPVTHRASPGPGLHQRAGPVASSRRGWWPDQSLGALPPALPHGSTLGRGRRWPPAPSVAVMTTDLCVVGGGWRCEEIGRSRGWPCGFGPGSALPQVPAPAAAPPAGLCGLQQDARCPHPPPRPAQLRDAPSRRPTAPPCPPVALGARQGKL